MLDEELPLWVPVPALAEMQVVLEQAVSEVTGLTGFELNLGATFRVRGGAFAFNGTGDPVQGISTMLNPEVMERIRRSKRAVIGSRAN